MRESLTDSVTELEMLTVGVLTRPLLQSWLHRLPGAHLLLLVSSLCQTLR